MLFYCIQNALTFSLVNVNKLCNAECSIQSIKAINNLTLECIPSKLQTSSASGETVDEQSVAMARSSIHLEDLNNHDLLSFNFWESIK